MPRPKEFSEIAALDAAVDCFWQRGYEATSMRDLAVSMGISAPSLYNAFGDKQTLFARALERYLDCGARDRFGPCMAEERRSAVYMAAPIQSK